MLEHAAEHEGLSLGVILVHSDCQVLHRKIAVDKAKTSHAQRELATALRSSAEAAKRSGRRLEEAHALRQAQHVYTLSPVLEKMRREDRFQVAIAIIEDKGGIAAQGKRIRWIAPWLNAPPARITARPTKD